MNATTEGHPIHTAAAGEPSRSAAERRVSVLVGDRFCATCGFNLVGQTVVREPHYSMLMVRCPECGTPAAMQEYPMLGRWANRWARVLAVAMIAFMTVFTVGASFACWGASIPPVWAMVEPLAERLGDAHVRWQKERRQTAINLNAAKKAAEATAAGQSASIPDGGGTSPNDPANPDAAATDASPSTDGTAGTPEADPAAIVPITIPPAGPTGTVVTVNGVVVSNTTGAPTTPPALTTPTPGEEDWWRKYADSDWAQAVDPRDVLKGGGGGWASGISWSGLKWLVVSIPVAFIFGVIYSVLLLGTRRWKAMLVIPIVLGLSMCWVLIEHLDGPNRWGGGLNDMAADIVGIPLHLIVFMFMAYAMAMGIWVGRPIARAFVRIMLPPRLCGSLADLWLCEGKTPPCAAQSRQSRPA